MDLAELGLGVMGTGFLVAWWFTVLLIRVRALSYRDGTVLLYCTYLRAYTIARGSISWMSRWTETGMTPWLRSKDSA